MSLFTFPELSPRAEPELVDAATCRAWLEHLPLANVAAAQRQLAAQLEELNRFPTSAANRLAILETLREAVNFVQLEQAKRFTHRAQPLGAAEAAVFRDTIGLWDLVRQGYLRCLEAAGNRDPALRAQAALVCQRVLAYSGLRMFHHHRAYQQVAAREWRVLHAAYAEAEALDVAEEPVKDLLNRDVHDTSPRIAYARAVLMGLCNPHELAQRQLTFVAFLLERWASKLEVLKSRVDEEGVPPLVADLGGEGAPERGEPAPSADPAALRYLDTRKLSKSLRNRIGLLRKGQSPASLALGEDCVQPSCEQLLVFLFRQWCQAKTGRSVERRRAAMAAKVCNGLEAAHYFVSGHAFRQPGGHKELSHSQRDEIATFGRLSARHDEDHTDAPAFGLEPWEIEDESAQGLRMIRRAAIPGRRFAHGQLIALRPADSGNFMLGQVRWLMSAENADLHAGIRLLPGLPAAIAVRATGLNLQHEEYVPALSLTAVQALAAPPALVLPAGWFKPRRVIDVFVDSALRVRLLEVLERGTDFERVAYELLG
jgi:cyclic-di-GMP-binding protein